VHVNHLYVYHHAYLQQQGQLSKPPCTTGCKPKLAKEADSAFTCTQIMTADPSPRSCLVALVVKPLYVWWSSTASVQDLVLVRNDRSIRAPIFPLFCFKKAFEGVFVFACAFDDVHKKKFA